MKTKMVIGGILLIILVLFFPFCPVEKKGPITARIDAAIAEFVIENGAIQHHISLPEKEFWELMDYANGTELGRSFTQYGLAYCTLPVTMNTGTEILICPEIVWE